MSSDNVLTARTGRSTQTARLLAAAMFVAAGCGGSDDATDEPTVATVATTDTPADTTDTVADTIRTVPATSSTTTTSAPPETGPTTATSTPAESADEAIDDETTADLIDAAVVDSIELERGDLGFLVSDGSSLWASGEDGVVVHIDPDSRTVDELDIGDGLVAGPLLPTVTGESIWFSEVQGTHVVRLDRQTTTPDPPIEVSGPLGLVIAGPGDRWWIEATQLPAGLRPFDPDTGTVGDMLAVDSDGEVVGSTAAFDSLWVPLYDDGVVLRMDQTGRVLDRVDVGLGPRLVREAAGALWLPNAIDGTIDRIDPQNLDVTTVDLNRSGMAVERPSGISATSDAIWSHAARIEDRMAIVFRIDPGTTEVVGHRSLPGELTTDRIGGMAAVGDRLFVLDRPGRVLLELATEQFLRADPVETDTTVVEPADANTVRDTIRILLSTSTTPEEMAASIVDGDRLGDQIAAFKQFFADNLPGEDYEGATVSVDIDGDEATVVFFVTVAGQPIVDPISGTLVRNGDRWQLAADAFCRLVATGGIECPSDLTDDP